MAQETEQNPKDAITRENVKSSLLKRVIIRADFTPLVDVESTFKKLVEQDWFKGKFESFDKILNTSKNGDDEGYNVEQQMFIRRFSDSRIEPEKNVVLDIMEETVCLSIDCDEHYTRIDPYRELVEKILAFIMTHDDYVKMKRLAIRKVDGYACKNGDEADKIFEYFDQGISFYNEATLQLRTYSDRFTYKPGEQNVRVNYTRQVKFGVSEEDQFVFIIDIDTYLELEQIGNVRPDEVDLRRMFKDRLNETSFELFKRSVKLEYLKGEVE